MRRELEFSHRAQHGFTLVELLVVIFIIVLLAGLLLPMVMRSFRNAGTLRTQGDFQAIASALEAYKTDFGDIPRIPTQSATGDPFPNTGAAILGKALLGNYGSGSPDAWDSAKKYNLGQCVSNASARFVCIVQEVPAGSAAPPSNLTQWAAFDPKDGADGPGFKTRAGAGKTWGPYVDATKFKSRGTILLDSNGFPILYFPARPGQVDVSNTTTPQYVGKGREFKYNPDDNFEFFRRPTDTPDVEIQHRIQVMLDDVNLNGILDTPADAASEKAVDQPYLLWAAGPDELFGPNGDYNDATKAYKFEATTAAHNRDMAAKCDDVTNFR